MHINLLLIPTLMLSISLFLFGMWVTNTRLYEHNRIVVAVVALLLSVPAVLYVAYYAHILDTAVWFYRLRALPYSELLASGAGFGGGALAGKIIRSPGITRSPSRKLLIGISAICCLTLLILIPYLKPFLSPLTVSLQDRWSEGVCLQSTPSTCGPSSAATLLRQFGISVSEQELAAECYTCGGGTENWYLARAFRRRGMAAEYEVMPPESTSLVFPSIAGVRLDGVKGPGHFIAILGEEEHRFIVGDPLVGKRRMTVDELRTSYYLTGFFLVVHPQGVMPVQHL